MSDGTAREPGKLLPVVTTDRPSTDTTLAAVTAAMRDALGRSLAPGLHIVATPIGNLADITLRAVATLATADVIYCEDTRHSRTLVTHFGIKTPLKPYHEHNADAARPAILDTLARGGRVALISDAGTPLISDPGYKLVNEAVAAGYVVSAIPGPSAAIAALSSAGLPTDSFHFAGFLSPKQQARRTRLGDLAAIPATLVLYEAPQRLEATLADIAALAPSRQVVVARELTKLHEELHRGTAAKLAEHFASTGPRGECVILIAPPEAAAEVTDAAIIARLEAACASMSVKDAARTVSEALRLPRSRVYDLALAIKTKRD